jgi:hypothetical protein
MPETGERPPSQKTAGKVTEPRKDANVGIGKRPVVELNIMNKSENGLR